MDNFDEIDIGGYECDICCNLCGKFFNHGTLTAIIKEVQEHNCEEYKREQEQRNTSPQSQSELDKLLHGAYDSYMENQLRTAKPFLVIKKESNNG